MPVNTAALKTFAPAMRRQLIEAVGRKLDRLLHQISADGNPSFATVLKVTKALGLRLHACAAVFEG